MKVVAIIFLVLFGLVVIAGGGAFYAILYTPLLVRAMLDSQVQKSQGHFSYRGVEGSLMAGVSIQGIHFDKGTDLVDNCDIKVNVGGLSGLSSGKWDTFQFDNCKLKIKNPLMVAAVPLAALQGAQKGMQKTLSLKKMGISHLRVETSGEAASSTPANPGTPPAPEAPKLSQPPSTPEAGSSPALVPSAIVVDDFSLENITLSSPNPTTPAEMSVGGLNIKSPQLELHGAGLHWDSAKKNLHWDKPMAMTVPPGQYLKAPLAVNVECALQDGMKGSVKFSFLNNNGQLEWTPSEQKAHLKVAGLNVAEVFTVGLPLTELGVEGDFEGAPKQWLDEPVQTVSFKVRDHVFATDPAEPGPIYMKDATGDYVLKLDPALRSFPPRHATLLKSKNLNMQETLVELFFGSKLAEVGEENKKLLDAMTEGKALEEGPNVIYAKPASRKKPTKGAGKKRPRS